jgi:hypothetical protein
MDGEQMQDLLDYLGEDTIQIVDTFHEFNREMLGITAS